MSRRDKQAPERQGPALDRDAIADEFLDVLNIMPGRCDFYSSEKGPRGRTEEEIIRAVVKDAKRALLARPRDWQLINELRIRLFGYDRPGHLWKIGGKIFIRGVAELEFGRRSNRVNNDFNTLEGQGKLITEVRADANYTAASSDDLTRAIRRLLLLFDPAHSGASTLRLVEIPATHDVRRSLRDLARIVSMPQPEWENVAAAAISLKDEWQKWWRKSRRRGRAQFQGPHSAGATFLHHMDAIVRRIRVIKAS